MDTSKKASGSLLGWLGFGGSREIVPDGSAAPRDSAFAVARQELLEQIARFLLAHNLEVSTANLIIAHDAFSGNNPGLARRLAAKVRSDEAITQEWLNETTANDDRPEQPDEIQILMTKLEAMLHDFATTSKTACDASTQYGDELGQYMADLEQVQDTSHIITSLAALAKAMLERTRSVELEMRRSEEEATSLRENLEQAKRDAEIDHLTGLPNRRAFETLLDTHYREARADIEPLCVAFCDIDHFKKVNDTHGHEAGDRVIKAIGDSLASISNDNCHVARHGGEEFVMLFRNVTLGEAKDRLDEVRESLAARKLVNRKTDKPFGQVTFSGGVADVFGYPNPREAMKAADEALYQAKEGGRNQVMIATA